MRKLHANFLHIVAIQLPKGKDYVRFRSTRPETKQRTYIKQNFMRFDFLSQQPDLPKDVHECFPKVAFAQLYVLHTGKNILRSFKILERNLEHFDDCNSEL